MKMFEKFLVINQKNVSPLADLMEAKGLTPDDDIAPVLDTVKHDSAHSHTRLTAYVEGKTAEELQRLMSGEVPDKIVALNGLNLCVRKCYSSEYTPVTNLKGVDPEDKGVTKRDSLLKGVSKMDTPRTGR